MNGLYTEYSNLTPYHVNWLDGCGAVWGNGDKFSDFKFSESTLCFANMKDIVDGYRFWLMSAPGSTHCTTGDEFCQGIAEILGIEYVPEKVAKDKAFQDSEQAVFDRAKDNPMILDRELMGTLPPKEVDISKMETTIKGMAIEVSRLSEGDKAWLVRNVQDAEMALFEYVGYGNLGDYKHIGYQSRQWYEDNGYTITESRSEFMEYVAQQKGKEYIRKLEITPEIRDRIQQKIKDRLAPPTYPHKIYRILDSLDGIPLDKRIPLSEWIPPYKKEVLFIHENYRFFGRFVRIDADGIIAINEGTAYITISECHWMRIV